MYREKIASLCSALESEESGTRAVDAIRALIETTLLEPDGDRLKIALKGDLAGMLSAAETLTLARCSRCYAPSDIRSRVRDRWSTSS
jgi:hypothetical protein